jgi:hypothetical protein
MQTTYPFSSNYRKIYLSFLWGTGTWLLASTMRHPNPNCRVLQN